MSKPADDERLLAVAGSISDGAPVDWNEVRGRFDDPEATAIIDELRVLHSVAAAHLPPSSWGQLHIFDVLGRGSFATVYRAFDADLQREVALKITDAQDVDTFDPQRAVHEARLLARVHHQNVVTVFSAQRREDGVALAMELIKGRTLDDLVRTQGPFSADEATLIGLDLCRALAAVHEAGLLHGDVKAHNVMREEGGRIVLMDFGTGRDLRAPASATTDFAGTPLYLAPEVFAGQPRTRTSDIYSLGILLFYLSTGAYPVSGSTRSEIDRQHAHEDPPRLLRDLRPDLPAAFVAVVERAMARDPLQRYRSAGEFERALTDSRSRKTSITTIAALVFLTAGISAAAIYGTYLNVNGRNQQPGPPVAPAPAVQPPSPEKAGVYRVTAAMYRVKDGESRRLEHDDRLAVRDELFLQVQTSAPIHVYVVNEDEFGTAMLLFPLPGQGRDPLPPNVPNRLPGRVAGEEKYWQVDSPGGREHFVIFFSPEPVPDVEQLVASLPAPRVDAPLSYIRVPPQLISKLRGVGGLVTAPNAQTRGRLSDRYTTPLSDGPEDASGLWVRQIAFANPVK